MIFFSGIAMVPLTGSQLEHQEGRARLIVGIALIIASNFFFSYSELLCRNYFKAQKMQQLTTTHPRVEFDSLHFDKELDKKFRHLFMIGGNALRILSLATAATAHFAANRHTFSSLDRVTLLFLLTAGLIAFVWSYPKYAYVRTKGTEWTTKTEDCC